MSGAATGDGRLELDDHGEVVDGARPRPVLVDLGVVDGSAAAPSAALESRSRGGAAPGRRGRLRTALVATAVCLVAASALGWAGQLAPNSTSPAATSADAVVVRGSGEDAWHVDDVSAPRRAAERGRASAATFRDPATGAVVMAYSPQW